MTLFIKRLKQFMINLEHTANTLSAINEFIQQSKNSKKKTLRLVKGKPVEADIKIKIDL